MLPIKESDIEIMAPVGSWESLAAALRAGADAVYFGVGRLNMRSHSAGRFTTDDLRRVAEECRRCGVKTYLTVNTIVYDGELDEMRSIIAAARQAQVTAVIASDVSVMQECRRQNMEVHLSTQLNISNVEALSFYAQFADVVVLARELTLDQVAQIHRQIAERHICGPSGREVRIEMFCHGALCMAVSGKCYLSVDNTLRSANRGQCMQLCRRSYTLTDTETGTQIDIDRQYLMSPKDLKTIRFLDRMLQAGVRVLKIEGRARPAEYVKTTVECYREAVSAVLDGTFTEQKKDAWDERLARVFNRGFWDGYYLGQRLGEWNEGYGSRATEQKVFIGRCTNYFSRLQVAEFSVQAANFRQGDRLLVTGPTTGALYLDVTTIHDDHDFITHTRQGTLVSVPVPQKVRRGDMLFRIDQG
ncbi:MAG: U32 family peptidase [Prevotella sp.]|nr:U32 family peptidase [Prevotella sp.]